MANSVWNRVYQAFKTFDQVIDIIIGHGFPPGSLYAVACNHAVNQVQPSNLPARSLKDVLNDAFLWAVPKKRRTIEKRLNRRFGYPKYNWKPHVPKTNILTCHKCGHHHEVGLLCGYCYEIVKKETQEMQEAILKGLGIEAVEKDVVVLYEGEKIDKTHEFWKNQRIIEMPKKRPDWFNPNLLQPISKELPNESTKKSDESDTDSSLTGLRKLLRK